MDSSINQTSHADKQYLHTMIAGALLPLTQSTIMAVVVAIGTWVIAYFVFDALNPHKPAILFFAVTWVYTMFKLNRHWLSLTAVEKIIMHDINGDGVIGEVTEQPAEVKPRKVVIQIDRVKEDGHYEVGDQSAWVNLPCDDEQLYTLALGLMNDMPFSEKQWTGKGKPFSTNEFRALRDAMKANDLTEYVNDTDPRQGIRLTEAGRAVMKEIAASPTPL